MSILPEPLNYDTRRIAAVLTRCQRCLCDYWMKDPQPVCVRCRIESGEAYGANGMEASSTLAVETSVNASKRASLPYSVYSAATHGPMS